MLKIGALVVAAVLAAAAAEAADFTFTVPVNARNLLPEVTRVFVNCSIFRGQTAVASASSAPAAPQSGAVQQNIAVEVNVPAGQDKTTIDGYRCYFYVGTAGTTSMPRTCQADWCRARPGTTTIDFRSGSISN